MHVYPNELTAKRAFTGMVKAAGGFAEEHEDSVSRYIPDVSFALFRSDWWVEVKHSKKPVALNQIDHYTIGQELWLMECGARGAGNCYLLYFGPDRIHLIRWHQLRDARKVEYGDLPSFCEAYGDLDDIMDFIKREAHRQRPTRG